ncbi:MAG: class I SAM-dependent methyltransferase [Gammaproteobacteria bacterium]|nr:class I SAM-dependent methyltransferase [Gammaproteobacteria bacterium]MCH9717127.1 class I SAM-dependent methyltransferase [Gammaproteobacteria bacterium]MCH9763754.1 class I SAM-dependent methyltransferase [Gammaproteobacteria bacterium]
MATLRSLEAGLALCIDNCTPILIDFEAVVTERCKQGLKKPAVLTACKPKPGLKILDATAGFGRDAAVLASAGADVLMCEREPMLQALLTDGLTRLNPSRGLQLDLISQDAKEYLTSLDKADYPDVIYIDPMHPARTKSARVKKDLHALQQLLGEDANPMALLTCARAHVNLRVVLKWPARSPSLLKPNHVIEGKTVRFDVYLPG